MQTSAQPGDEADQAIARLYAHLRAAAAALCQVGDLRPAQRTQPGARAERTLDHVDALANGGRHEIGNLAVACRSCNSRFGARKKGYSREVFPRGAPAARGIRQFLVPLALNNNCAQFAVRVE